MELGQLDALRLLVKAGAPVDAQNESGTTCLHVACSLAPRGDAYMTMAEILITAGANVHAVNDSRLVLLFRLQLTTEVLLIEI